MNRLGVRLKLLRTRAGLTQTALGAAMRPPKRQEYIHNYECGLWRLPAEALLQIAAILQVPLTAFQDKDDAR